MDPDIADRVLSRSNAAKLRELEPLTLEGARQRFGARISEEELLLRLTMPAEQVDAMVAARDGGSSGAARPPRGPGARRSSRCCRSCERRPSLTSVELDRRDGDRWSGAVLDGLRLDDVRGFMFDVDGTLLHRGPDGRAHPAARAPSRCSSAIRASGRRLVLFTNGSHVAVGRRSPAGCATTACRSPTRRCSPRSTAPPPTCAAATRHARCWPFASDAGQRAHGRRRGSRWPRARTPRWCSWPTSTRLDLGALERAARGR